MNYRITADAFRCGVMQCRLARGNEREDTRADRWWFGGSFYGGALLGKHSLATASLCGKLMIRV